MLYIYIKFDNFEQTLFADEKLSALELSFIPVIMYFIPYTYLQSPTQALTAAAAANPYMIMQPELMYATPQAYQSTELADAAMIEGATMGTVGTAAGVEVMSNPFGL